MPEQHVTEFGARLRRAREARGVTLRQISNATRISVRALEAVERSDASRLPGGIFTRSFVRAYAVEVGLDPDSAVQEFLRQVPQDPASSQAGLPLADHAVDGVPSWTQRAPVRTVVTTLVVAAAVGAIGYSAYRWWGDRIAGPRAASDHARVLPAPPAATDDSERAPAVAGASRQEVPAAPAATSPAPAVREAPLTITIASRGACWLSVAVDGRRVDERTMAAGERTIVRADREVVLKFGDAGAVALTINGQPARAIGASGEVVTARIGVDNLREYIGVP